MRAINPLYRTELTLLEKLNDEDTEPSEAENMAWIKRFGAKGKKTGYFDQSGPIYEITGPKEALQRLWTNYDAMSSIDYDPNEDYGIADEDNQWWDDYIEKIDTNDDGDDDIATYDTNDDGNPDTAVVTADSKAEEKDAVKAAKEKLGIDKQTSTGKTKAELDTPPTLSDKNQKNVPPKKDNPSKKKKGELLYDEEQDSGLVGLMKKMSPARNKKQDTVSDITQKNILKALTEHRF